MRHDTGPWSNPSKGNGCVRSDGVVKVGYPDEVTASLAADVLTRDKAEEGETWFEYECECGLWHIGRPPITWRRSPRLRHREEWLMELGDRAELHRWLAGSRPEWRVRNIAGMLAVALERKRWRQEVTDDSWTQGPKGEVESAT